MVLFFCIISLVIFPVIIKVSLELIENVDLSYTFIPRPSSFISSYFFTSSHSPTLPFSLSPIHSFPFSHSPSLRFPVSSFFQLLLQFLHPVPQLLYPEFPLNACLMKPLQKIHLFRNLFLCLFA